MNILSSRNRIAQLVGRISAVLIVLLLVISVIPVGDVYAYRTAGALGRSLGVYPGFTINRSLMAYAGTPCRSGQFLTNFSGVTIHETSNWSSNANALMHAKYLQGSGASAEVSWHYAVDNISAYQSIPENEKAWHAGDTGKGKGNASTIAIEICDNSSGDFDQAMANAEWLAADILYRHGVYTVNGYLYQHNYFSAYGKNCPITIRDTGRWGEFVAKTQAFLDAMVVEKGTYTPILMTATATVDQAKHWAETNGATPQFIMLANTYWELSPAAGVNPVIAYAQAAQATVFGNYTGTQKPGNFNPGDLKTSDGVSSQSFTSLNEGVQAHIDHLALLAGQLGYPRANTKDANHGAGLYGKCIGVENLPAFWGMGADYGKQLMYFISAMKSADKTPYIMNAEVQSAEVISYENGQYLLSLTMRNSGAHAWTEDIGIRLGYLFDNTLKRVLLPPGTIIKPGESYTFLVAVPVNNDGTMKHISAKMVCEGVKWFGASYEKDILPYDADISFAGALATLPGELNTVQIAVRNSGLNTWSEGQSIRLGITSDTIQDRVTLPAGVTVAPGQTYSFAYQMKAPLSGTLTLSAKMLIEGVAWFGEGKTYSIPVKNPSTAEITSAVFSEGITAGGAYSATITVKNTDQVPWTEKNLIRLGAFIGNTQTRGVLPAGVTVAPGESYIFTITGTAPVTGDLVMNTQMLQEGVCWFGETKASTVKATDSVITSISGPLATLPGEINTLQVTVKNTGLCTWSEGKSFRLGLTNGNTQDRVYLPAGVTVAPGQSYTFTYQAKAPQSGTLTVSAKMLIEGVAWFGEGKTYAIPVKNPSAAEITSAVLSAGITAGGAYTATITVKNTDQVPWTEKNLIRLGVIVGNTQTRGVLPAGVSVAPGASYTFTIAGTAPVTGDLVMKTQMLQEGVCWFGGTKSSVAKSTDSVITSISGPLATLPGDTNTLQVTVKNTGLGTWSEGKSFRLGLTNGNIQDRVTLPAGVTVATGQSYTFTYQAKAPQSGTLTVSAQMLVEGIAWFGEGKTYTIPVKNPSAAEITSAVLPAGITAGGAYTATITVKNTDQVPWTEKNLVRLGVIVGNTQTRVFLPAGVSVAPGASYAFAITGTAPLTGDLVIDMQMVQDGVSWFGEKETLRLNEINIAR